MICPKCGAYMGGELSAVDSWAAGTDVYAYECPSCGYRAKEVA